MVTIREGGRPLTSRLFVTALLREITRRSGFQTDRVADFEGAAVDYQGEHSSAVIDPVK